MEPAEPQTESERVEAWRLHVLIQAGYPVRIAELIAEQTQADLHRAVDLLGAGCKPAVAALIVL